MSDLSATGQSHSTTPGPHTAERALGKRQEGEKLTGSPRGPAHPGEPCKWKPESEQSDHPTHSSKVSHHVNCKGKACSPSDQGLQESQGGQGCREAHLPQGSPKEAKRSEQEGSLPRCPWFAGGVPTDSSSPGPLTPQAQVLLWGEPWGQDAAPELNGAKAQDRGSDEARAFHASRT